MQIYKIITTFAQLQIHSNHKMNNETNDLLDQKRLKEALVQLKTLTTEAGNWKLQSKTETIETTYRYLLQYAAQGQEDPERNKLFNGLCASAYEVADELQFTQNMEKAYGDLADKYRLFKIKPARSYEEIFTELIEISRKLHIASENGETEASQLELKKRHQSVLDELFNKTWASTHWSNEEFYAISRMVCAEADLPCFDLSVFISAATLNLLYYFDHYKFKFLLNMYLDKVDLNIRYRALVGIALSLYYYESRIGLYPDEYILVCFLCDQPDFNEHLHQTQLLFLLSRETEKIDKKMREEILPEIMKNSQLTSPDLKINEIDLKELEEKNPEWESSINKMNDRLRELGELQMEGADTYMSTFSQLKNYPFFREAAHWFYPFDMQTPEIASLFADKILTNSSLLAAMMDSPVFCNSDKYSFCLTLRSIPEQQLKMMSVDISGQEDAIKEQFGGILSKQGEANDKILCRQYLQDIYRFFKLWSFRKQQHDIFTDKLTLWKCRTLRPIILKGEYKKEIADYLFSKGYLSEATELYWELSNEIPNDAEIKQKLGFSLQKMKYFKEAIKAYQLVDILKPNDAWTLKHLAQCHKRTKNFEKAIHYFQQVEKLEPDNLNLALQIGQCLATLRSYDQALSYFFKVEYLGKTPENARRAIGWCYFMTGQYDKAACFYEKIINQSTPKAEDWLNYGHVYFLKNEIPKAVECYNKTASKCASHDEFVKLFLSDKNTLLEQGISEESIYIMLDLI